VDRLEREIARAEHHVAQQPSTGAADDDGGVRARAVTRDIAVVAGIALTMLGIKALKILPSVPFAPGHKLVVLTPLYIVASQLTRGRFGATLTGVTMGTVAFLMGDGKYGIFEILKHTTPGVLCDLVVPILLARGRRPGPLAWSLFGALIGAGRFATIFAVTFLVQAPAAAFLFLLPGIGVHVVFGAASGYVSRILVLAIDRRAAAGPDAAEPDAASFPEPRPEESRWTASS
jgi:hypothetical protein